jgi:hypothetical protein
MKISFLLKNNQQVDRLDKLLLQSGENQTDFFRRLLMSSTPPPAAIDLDAYKCLLEIVSDLRKIIDLTSSDTAINALVTGVEAKSQELAIRIITSSNEMLKSQ